MKIIWSRSGKPLSKLIRWGLGCDCSHFAIVFNSPGGGLMFESNLIGTHPKFFETAKKHMEIVHEIEIPMTIEQEDEIWDKVVSVFDNRPYDFGAFFYLVWRGILRNLFGVKFPKQNRWAKPHAYLCDELYKCLDGHVPVLELDIAMTPPHDLYHEIMAANGG